ncbi:hypothetical protein F4778DRAFT_474074 [Xylariomycetidae sp. FL2044]|nr:hypothetical protein F4778DRAFT_474074 [Xylariomycetidae sp. FL2044]
MTSLRVLLLLLGVLASCATAAAPTFCKCSCFKNSTLIQLGPQTTPPSTDSKSRSGSASSSSHQQLLRLQRSLFSHEPRDPEIIAVADTAAAAIDPRAASSSCTQCTRAFCLTQNLPICKDAEETDVVATCFQRDSRKDQIIVWGFILGTLGLLGWAAAKRVVEMREERRKASLAAAAGLGGGDGPRDRGIYIPVGAGHGG